MSVIVIGTSVIRLILHLYGQFRCKTGDVKHYFFTGVFTCKVEDFGNIVEGNVAVKVNNYPRVQLDPMSLSVNKGKTITFKCLSPDDSWQQFTYEWYKVKYCFYFVCLLRFCLRTMAINGHLILSCFVENIRFRQVSFYDKHLKFIGTFLHVF